MVSSNRKRIGTVAASVALLSGLLAFVSLPPPVSASVTVGSWPGAGGPIAANQQYGYPYPDASACTAGGPCVLDKWDFYQGQCTSWVAYRLNQLNQLNGIAFSDDYLGQHWGNATDWGSAAKAARIPVNGTPAVGSVAWYAGKPGDNDGHVAYVEEVLSPTEVVISEMNYDFKNGFRVRQISTSSSWPTDFIHFHTPVPVQAPVGTLSVVAGDNPRSDLGIPEGLAVDAHGDLFIAESGTADSGNYVVELTPGGKLSVVAGDGQGESGLTPGPATRSSVDGAGMAVDPQGDLFIADYYRDVVLEVTPARNLSVVAGVFAKAGPPKRGLATSSTLDGPVAVAVDAHGDLFIADRGNYVVEKVTPAGMLSVVAGIGNYGPTKPGPATRSGVWPFGVAVDASGNLFIADDANYVVDEVTPAGKLSVVAGVPDQRGPEVPGGPATSSDLGDVTAIAVDRQGDLFIAENGAVVDEVSRAGQLSVVAGDGKVGRPRPGPATKSGLGGLSGVAVNARGDLFIADCGPTPYGPYSVEKVTF